MNSQTFARRSASRLLAFVITAVACLVPLSQANAQTVQYCTTKVTAVMWNSYGTVWAVTGLGVMAICQIDSTMNVDNGGNNSVTPAQCQYLYSGLLNAKNSQSDVMFVFASTATHSAPACATNMFNWMYPDPYPENIFFY
jgi:hypothetical protein